MNTLKVAKQLQEAGCDSKVAEAISLIIEEAVDSKAATKSDLLEVKNELKEEIHQLENKLTDKITGLQTHMVYWGFALIGLLITYLEFRWR